MTDTPLLSGPAGNDLIPLEPTLPAGADAHEFRIDFGGHVCHSPAELALCMADSWEEARAAILTGALAQALDSADLAAAAICRDAAAAVAAGHFTPDRAVLEVIHRLSGEVPVVWCGRRYSDAADLGGSLLQALRGTGTLPPHFSGLMTGGAASVFVDPSRRAGLQALESRCAAPDCSPREQMLLAYMAGFLLSGVAAFVTEGETFYTVEELAAWLESRARRSIAAFSRACHRLLDENHLLDPQLEAWLIAIGRRQDVARWQTEIDAGML